MQNKIFIKFAGLFLSFIVIDILVIFYWLTKCRIQLPFYSSFYCERGMGVIFILGVAILILATLAIILFTFLKWHRGNVSKIIGEIIIALGIIIFIAPYMFYWFSEDEHPKTFNKYVELQKQWQKKYEGIKVPNTP